MEVSNAQNFFRIENKSSAILYNAILKCSKSFENWNFNFCYL